MNAAELKKLIVKADRSKLCEALKPLDEDDRAALAEDAIRIFRIVDAGKFLGANDTHPTGLEDEEWFDPKFLSQLRKAEYQDWRVPRMVAAVMILGLVDDKVLKDPYKFGLSGWFGGDLRDMPHRVLQVLDDRRPKWLPAFVKRELRQEEPIVSWSVEYGLMKSGAIKTEHSEGFFKRMAEEHKVFYTSAIEVKTDNLKSLHGSHQDYFGSEQALLDLIWNLFEFDTFAFSYAHNGWFESLKGLSEKKKLDRQRLLKASAESMIRPFRPTVVAGFGKFHELLEPSLDERESVVDNYLNALSSEHSMVVGTALSALDKLLKAKRLDANALLEHIDGAFRIPKKAQPVKAIKLVQTLVKQQSEAAGRSTEVLVTALDHERVDVQEAGVAALEKLASNFTPKTIERLSQCAVAPSLKARVEQLAGTEKIQGQSAGAKNKKTNSKSSATKGKSSTSAVPKALLDRAKKIPANLQQATGLAVALETIGEGAPVVPLIDPASVPRNEPALEVKPIESVEELVDSVAAVIERADDPMEIERILDGISRFHRQKPNGVLPLKKRIEKLSEPYSQSVLDLGARVGFSQLLRRWLEMPPVHDDRDDWYEMAGLTFRLRARDVEWLIDGDKEPAGRLALPTHQNGWIDPKVFVQRIENDYLKQRRLLDEADLAQALLRLAPQGRSAALKKLLGLTKDDWDRRFYCGGEPVRYALGDSDAELQLGEMSRDRRIAIAATRCRMLVEGPDFVAAVPVAEMKIRADGSVTWSGPVFEDMAIPVDLIHRSLSLDNFGKPGQSSGQAMVRQLDSLICPSDPDMMFMLGWLERLFDCDLTWTAAAARAAVMGLSSDNKDTRLQATDALIAGISEARVRPDMVGMQIFSVGKYIKLKRIGDAFTVAIRVSTLHCSSIAQMIDQAIRQYESLPSDAHHLLTPMLEAMLESGIEASPEAREKLAIKGSSKTAKLAKQVSNVEVDLTKQMNARIEAVAAIADRAERWQRLSS